MSTIIQPSSKLTDFDSEDGDNNVERQRGLAYKHTSTYSFLKARYDENDLHHVFSNSPKKIGSKEREQKKFHFNESKREVDGPSTLRQRVINGKKREEESKERKSMQSLPSEENFLGYTKIAKASDDEIRNLMNTNFVVEQGIKSIISRLIRFW